MGNWKIGIAYQRYGYINVPGDTRKEAIANANKWLEGATIEELDAATDYLQDSEEVDEEFVEEVVK